jgi:hypothetical protein
LEADPQSRQTLGKISAKAKAENAREKIPMSRQIGLFPEQSFW